MSSSRVSDSYKTSRRVEQNRVSRGGRNMSAQTGLVYQLPIVTGEVAEPPCHLCPAICCNYIAVEIDKPTSKSEFEQIRWYLMHEKIHVFVDEGEWFLQVWNRCDNLQADNSCAIYETRPEICREYGADKKGEVNCHAVAADNEEYDLLFTEPAQIEAYYEKWYKKRYGKKKKNKTGKKRKS